MKKKQCILVIIILLLVVSAVNAAPFTLPDLMNALQADNAAWQNNEASSKAGYSQYLSNRASLFPSITGDLPLSYSGYLNENTPEGYTRQEGNSLSIRPGISLTQLIPTAGLLSATVSDEITRSEITNLNNTSFDPVWNNSINVSAALSQPIYFGNAYQAAKTAIEKNLENNRLKTLEMRNQLVIAAIQDYYNIKQALYTRELIQSRLEKDRENYKRVEREWELGLWTKSVLYQAQTLLIKSETDLLEGEQTLEALMGLFRSSFGLEADPEFLPEVILYPREEMEIGEIIAEVRANSPETVQISNGLDLQRSAIVSYEKEHAPVFTLGGGWNMNNGLKDNEATGSSFSISLGISANLYDGGSFRNTRDKMDFELEGIEETLTARTIQLENQTRGLLDSITRALQLAELYDLQEEASRYEYEKGLLDLELGQITKKELSEHRINLENALLAIQQNKININIYYLHLLSSMGRDLSELEFLKKEL